MTDWADKFARETVRRWFGTERQTAEAALEQCRERLEAAERALRRVDHYPNAQDPDWCGVCREPWECEMHRIIQSGLN